MIAPTQRDRGNADRDKALKEAVLTQLWDTDSIGVDVNVRVTDGHTDLYGVVDTYAEKLAAAKTAAAVSGVRGVNNQLTVGVDSQITDKHIEKEIINRLSHSPARDLTASVSKGTVTLRGDVADLATKEQALQEVAEVRGVGGVNASVDVTGSPRDGGPAGLDGRDDATLTSEVNRVLTGSLEGEGSIAGRVANGHLTLYGQVENEELRRRAEELTETVKGVRSINNEVEIVR